MNARKKRDIRAAVWFCVGVAIFGVAIVADCDDDLQIAGIALCAAAAITRAVYLVLMSPEGMDDAA